MPKSFVYTRLLQSSVILSVVSSASSPPPVGQEHRDGEVARDWSEDRDDDDDDWIDGAVLARDEVEEISQVALYSG